MKKVYFFQGHLFFSLEDLEYQAHFANVQVRLPQLVGFDLKESKKSILIKIKEIIVHRNNSVADNLNIYTTMAKQIIADSAKTFGGNAVPAGTYLITNSVITKEKLTLPDGTEKDYEALQLCFKTETGVAVESTLSLNGCWRARRGADDRPYKASGNFFEQLLGACTGKSFSQTRDFINATFANRKVIIAYVEYPSTSGGYGKVPVVNFG